MDRRSFLKTGAAVVAAAELSAAAAMAKSSKSKKKPKTTKGPFSSEQGAATSKDLKVRFLGTGAADWFGRDERGELRRRTSILIDDKIFIDLTESPREMIPEGVYPEVIFYTHSHDDHYNPITAMQVGIRKVYVSETWVDRAKGDFAAGAAVPELVPEIYPLALGQRVTIDDITITALPANHSTGYMDEQTLIYLIEKGDVRVLYATDTGGIPSYSARIAGIDIHRHDGKPITGLIMEATMGLGYDEDYRIFTHSSVGTVLRTTNMITEMKRYFPPEGQPVYLTHMARELHATQKELDRTLPYPLRAPYDGLEVIFRPNGR